MYDEEIPCHFLTHSLHRISVEKQYYVMQRGRTTPHQVHSQRPSSFSFVPSPLFGSRIQLKNELEKVKGRGGKHKSRIAVAASKTQTKMRHSLNMVWSLSELV
jgi:hypothetical protein